VCLVASLALNAAALTTLFLAAQIQSARSASERMAAELRRELHRYRMVLLLPPAPKPAPSPPKAGPGPHPAKPPAPLAEPDPRLLELMDPQVVAFVRENAAVEDVITREIVRDVDRKVLDLQGLLNRSSIRASFRLNEKKHAFDYRIEKSSGVPSIDHLVLELLKLLNKYRLLEALGGIRRVTAKIEIEREISIELVGDLRSPAESAEIHEQIQGALTLLRFLIAKSEASFLLEDLSLTADAGRLRLRRSFDKTAIVEFLREFLQAPQ
jgi:hypothetical protein